MGPFIPRNVGGLESSLTHTLALAFIPRDMVGHGIGHELGSSDLGEQLVVWVTLPRLRARDVAEIERIRSMHHSLPYSCTLP